MSSWSVGAVLSKASIVFPCIVRTRHFNISITTNIIYCVYPNNSYKSLSLISSDWFQTHTFFWYPELYCFCYRELWPFWEHFKHCWLLRNRYSSLQILISWSLLVTAYWWLLLIPAFIIKEQIDNFKSLGYFQATRHKFFVYQTIR